MPLRPSPAAACPLCASALPAKTLQALARHFPECPSTAAPGLVRPGP